MTGNGHGASASRSYAASVTLVRRSRRYAEASPPSCFTDDIEDWLLTAALDQSDLLYLFEDFVWRLVDTGLPLDRASLHFGTLHPQLYGFGCNWELDDRFCDEIKVPQETLASDAYRKNPLCRVIEVGETVHARMSDAAAVARHPLLGDLAKAGFSDYFAMPLRTGSRYHNAITIATKRPGGFPPQAADAFIRTARIFALHVERHIAEKLAANVVTTYLGREAGERVLEGSIRRGDGLPLDAVIWVSDLRDFTDLTDRLPPEDVLRVLNAYFGVVVAAIAEAGGEVLKFMGDGLLAVFSFDHFASPQDAARTALEAAGAALRGVEALARDEIGAEATPLRSGIALHEGRVFFGNIGGADRLDFTVIGRAVNTASRIEGMTKPLGRPVLLSREMARLIDTPVDDLGAHRLRGVSDPVALYAPSGL
ncbi:adenylate/guanylate cyclase domain-containing protein [Stappia sp. ES.058]|uniref:adenylate/guanylate cyclase domain-containing protein n=1 Tax=Stappia sp. ES.058 TaxID=1881061 RepID=UPI00087D2661|nr:adenylate/guanylate cyclase domain-containing protein [Stappia sp. ES.058]SDU26462.1 adenylate cyclase [Stappia sp. ES.058]